MTSRTGHQATTIASGVAILIAAFTCPWRRRRADGEPAAMHHEHGTSPVAAPMPGDSLFQLPVQFTTARVAT